jgi:hypothetical protein
MGSTRVVSFEVTAVTALVTAVTAIIYNKEGYLIIWQRFSNKSVWIVNSKLLKY